MILYYNTAEVITLHLWYGSVPCQYCSK